MQFFPASLPRTINSPEVSSTLTEALTDLWLCGLQDTGGVYGVAMHEKHLEELIMEHSPPPPSIAAATAASLVRPYYFGQE